MSVARVSASEAVQLRILHAALGRPAVGVDTLLRDALPSLPRLRPTACALVRDTLRKGLVFELARRGGVRPGRCVHEGVAREGRVFDRHPPIALELTSVSEDVLRWMASAPLGATLHRAVGSSDDPTFDAPSLGDELWMLFAADLLARQHLTHVVPKLASSRLVRLAFGGLLPPSLASAPLAMDSSLVVLLEALAPELTRAWRFCEEHRRRLRSPDSHVAFDASLSATLDALLAHDVSLAFFVADAARPYLRDVAPRAWAPWLERKGSASARASAMRASGSLLRAALRLRPFVEHAGTVAFFDDDYAAAQLVLSSLGDWRDRGFREAETIVARLGSLDAVTDTHAGGSS